MSDRTQAVALEVAERELQRLGYRYASHEIGEVAAKIVNALHKNIVQQDHTP